MWITGPINHIPKNNWTQLSLNDYRVSMRTFHRIEQLLSKAEEEQRCAVPTSDNDRRALKRRVCEGEVQQIHIGCFVRTHYWQQLNLRQRAQHLTRAMVLHNPSLIPTGPSALCLHDDIDYPYAVHEQVERIFHVATNDFHRIVPTKKLSIHMLHSRELVLETINGVTMPRIDRIMVDCAAVCSKALVLPIFDWAKKENLPIEQILKLPIRNARELADLRWLIQHANALSDNGAESWVRATIILLGFVEPVVQAQFDNPRNPMAPLRTDFLWIFPDGSYVVLEYDGMAEYGEERTQVRRFVMHERWRDEVLKSQGVRKIIHINYEDVIHPERLEKILVEAGIPRC